jgi:carboxylesterase
VTAPVLAGAEAWSSDGGPAGVLCLHGFGGSPMTMRAMGEAFAAARFTVDVPRLPGHGTAVDDLIGTGWADWVGEAEAGLARVRRRGARVAVVVGQSMGGSLGLWLAAHHPDVAGLVCINAPVRPQPAEMVEMVEEMVAAGEAVVPAGPPDVADPSAVELAYDATPLVPLLSLMSGLGQLAGLLGRVVAPVLVAVSPQDHTVDPADADLLSASVAGPVERLVLERSYHVATLDHDAALLRRRAVDFARRVTTGA